MIVYPRPVCHLYVPKPCHLLRVNEGAGPSGCTAHVSVSSAGRTWSLSPAALRRPSGVLGRPSLQAEPILYPRGPWVPAQAILPCSVHPELSVHTGSLCSSGLCGEQGEQPTEGGSTCPGLGKGVFPSGGAPDRCPQVQHVLLSLWVGTGPQSTTTLSTEQSLSSCLRLWGCIHWLHRLLFL